MSTPSITLTQSLHTDECGCTKDDAEKSARTFFARVRRAHPAEFKRVAARLPVSSAYIDLRERLGDGPKRLPNPDAIPLSRRRRLPKADWTELERRKRLHKSLSRFEEAILAGYEIDVALYTLLAEEFERRFESDVAPLSLHRVKAAA